MQYGSTKYIAQKRYFREEKYVENLWYLIRIFQSFWWSTTHPETYFIENIMEPN